MSTIASSAKATFTLSGFETSEALALSVYDYLTNHPDEIPEGLDDDDYDSDTVVEMISDYLEVDGDKVTIKYGTEEDGCYSSNVFDFLTSHFAPLQTGLYMTVEWLVDDSRSGYSSGTDYYDQKGNPIDIEAAITNYVSSMQGMGAS